MTHCHGIQLKRRSRAKVQLDPRVAESLELRLTTNLPRSSESRTNFTSTPAPRSLFPPRITRGSEESKSPRSKEPIDSLTDNPEPRVTTGCSQKVRAGHIAPLPLLILLPYRSPFPYRPIRNKGVRKLQVYRKPADNPVKCVAP